MVKFIKVYNEYFKVSDIQYVNYEDVDGASDQFNKVEVLFHGGATRKVTGAGATEFINKFIKYTSSGNHNEDINNENRNV